MPHPVYWPLFDLQIRHLYHLYNLSYRHVYRLCVYKLSFVCDHDGLLPGFSWITGYYSADSRNIS